MKSSMRMRSACGCRDRPVQFKIAPLRSMSRRNPSPFCSLIVMFPRRTSNKLVKELHGERARKLFQKLAPVAPRFDLEPGSIFVGTDSKTQKPLAGAGLSSTMTKLPPGAEILVIICGAEFHVLGVYTLFPFLSTPLFNGNQKWRGEEYRRIRAGDNADQEREREILGRFRSEHEEYREHERGRERGIDGAYEGLIEPTANNLFKQLFSVSFVVY